MQMMFLNLALVGIAGATAGSAIFGETRKDGRITTIGWIALVGCVLTFLIGVTKEIQSQQAVAIAERDAALEKQNSEEMARKIDVLIARTQNLERVNQAESHRLPSAAAEPPLAEKLVFESRIDESVRPDEFSGQLIKREGGWESGAEAQLITADGKVLQTTHTDSDGMFRFTLPSRSTRDGELNILLSSPGKKSLALKDVHPTTGTTLVMIPIKVELNTDTP